MLKQNPVKIPERPGKINFMRQDGKEYVRYLADRKYNAEKGYTESDWILIGRRIDGMPGLMYPNDKYEQYFEEEETGMEETMTPEELLYTQNNSTYGLYSSFFDGIYHEFKQQTRKKADEPVNRYKAESINKILQPLQEMMKDEAYAGFLGLIETGEENGEEGMSYSDAMILLTQYKSALGKYHRSHP